MNSATGKAWELGPVAAAKEKRTDKKHAVRVARALPRVAGRARLVGPGGDATGTLERHNSERARDGGVKG